MTCHYAWGNVLLRAVSCSHYLNLGEVQVDQGVSKIQHWGHATSSARWETHDQVASSCTLGIFGVWSEWYESPLFGTFGWISLQPSTLDESVNFEKYMGRWSNDMDWGFRLLSVSTCAALPLCGILGSETAWVALDSCELWDEKCKPENPLADISSLWPCSPTCAGLWYDWSHLRFKFLVCKTKRLLSLLWYDQKHFLNNFLISFLSLMGRWVNEVWGSWLHLAWHHQTAGIRCHWAVPARMASLPKQTSSRSCKENMTK